MPSGTVEPRNLTAQFHAMMLELARENGANQAERGEEIMESQAERILTAGDDVDAIMRADLGGTIQCRDVPGTYWQINNFAPFIGTRTDIENTHGYYVQFDAVCLGGDADVMAKNGLAVGVSYPLQTSALLLTTKISALKAAEKLPAKLALIGIRTGSGNMVLKWGPMPVTVSEGSAG